MNFIQLDCNQFAQYCDSIQNMATKQLERLAKIALFILFSCSPGGLCGPTAIGGAHAIVGAGIIKVDMANIFRLNSIFAVF